MVKDMNRVTGCQSLHGRQRTGEGTMRTSVKLCPLITILIREITPPRDLLPPGTTLKRFILGITQGPEKLMPKLMVRGQVQGLTLIVTTTTGMVLVGMQLGHGKTTEKGAAVVLFVMDIVIGVIAGKDIWMKEGTAA